MDICWRYTFFVEEITLPKTGSQQLHTEHMKKAKLQFIDHKFKRFVLQILSPGSNPV
jgi:hypothetical protein